MVNCSSVNSWLCSSQKEYLEASWQYLSIYVYIIIYITIYIYTYIYIYICVCVCVLCHLLVSSRGNSGEFLHLQLGHDLDSVLGPVPGQSWRPGRPRSSLLRLPCRLRRRWGSTCKVGPQFPRSWGTPLETTHRERDRVLLQFLINCSLNHVESEFGCWSRWLVLDIHGISWNGSNPWTNWEGFGWQLPLNMLIHISIHIISFYRLLLLVHRSLSYDSWLVVRNMWITLPYIGCLIIPTDEFIFFRGAETTKQIVISHPG